MLRLTTVANASATRGFLLRRSAPLLSARAVPGDQPSPHDTTWFTRNTHVGAPKAPPSVGQMAAESALDDVARDLGRQKRKIDIEDSIKRNSASSSTSSSTFTKVNLTDDYRVAAEAERDTVVGEKGTTITAADGTTVDVGSAEAAEAYVKRLDLSHMPAIPGMAPEELAMKLLEFEKKRAQQVAQHLSGEAEHNRRINEIEAMRMSMSPRDFKEFMETMEKEQEASEAELEKMRGMTPQQLFAYQKQKAVVSPFWRFMDFCTYWGMATGGTFMMYYIMFKHFAL